ncbi:MAG: sulfatase-like hydrolase/transferase [Polyangiaceae bacterium]
MSRGLLAIAHVRGIHPPWDVTPSEASLLPPPEYTGAIEPRRAGQTLERVRRKKHGLNKLTPPDMKRIEAMTDVAMAQTDRALSNLIDTLRKANLWNDTLFIVTSDVAVPLDPTGQILPFAEVPEMSERALRVPLYVHFPGGDLAGRRVDVPTMTVDLTRTTLAALGIDAPGRVGGMDLHALVERGALPIERPSEATLPDRWASRWADLRLFAKEGAPPQLCDLKTDPACEKDIREQLPNTTLQLWRWTYDYEFLGRDPSKRLTREPATIDADTAAALGVWGK